MLKTSAFLPGILTCLLMPAYGADALAGNVKLVSDSWDSVCLVEVTWGANAAEGTPVEYHSDVPRNWSITKPDRLCYRRASTPDNCNSGMTQWKTQWKCAVSDGSGTEELSLQ